MPSPAPDRPAVTRPARRPAAGCRHPSSVKRLETLREAPGVRLLGPGQRLEPFGNLHEALVARRLGEAGIHLGVLVGLALDGRLEVVLGGADGHAGDGVSGLAQEVEVPEGVPGLSLSDRAEERRHVGVTLDVRLLREVQVAAVGLALAGERLFEIGLGLTALQCCHGWYVPFSYFVGCGSCEICEPRHSSHSPRKTTSALSTTKPCARRADTVSPGKSAARSRTLPHERQTRWWCVLSTFGSKRAEPVPTSSTEMAPS